MGRIIERIDMKKYVVTENYFDILRKMWPHLAHDVQCEVDKHEVCTCGLSYFSKLLKEESQNIVEVKE
jgi:hypothetical protein